jgi:multidrug efflux pump
MAGVPGEFMSYLPIMVIIVLTSAMVTALIFLPVMGIVSLKISRFLSSRRIILSSLALGLAVGFALAAFATTLIGLPLSLTMGTLLIGLIATLMLYPVLKRVLPAYKQGSHPGDYSAHNATSSVPALTADNKEQGQGHVPVVAHPAGQAMPYREDNPNDAVPVFDVNSVKGITGFYVRQLAWLAGTARGNILTLGVIVALAIASLTLFMQFNKGVEFFVQEEPEIALVLVSARGNISATEARDLVVDVEDKIRNVSGIEALVTVAHPVGASRAEGSGSPAMTQDKPNDLIGEIQMELEDYCCRRPAREIFEEIRNKVSDMPGLRVELRQIEGGPPTGKDIRLEVRSTDYQDSLETARRVRRFLENDMEGLRDIEDDTPLPGIEWQIAIDRTEAGRFGANVAAVGPMVQLVTNGVLIDTYREDDSEDEIDIRVRLPREERSLDQLDNLRLQTPGGLVPLANFVTREPAPRVSSITRKDGLYTTTVKANTVAGVLPDTKVKEIQDWLDSESFPESVAFRFRGADEEQKESGEFLMKAMMASLFLMFVILVTQFNSFYQASLTLFTIVLAVFGVLLGMVITGRLFPSS